MEITHTSPEGNPFFRELRVKTGAFEAKNTLGSLLDRVERGEEIVITRHGKAVDDAGYLALSETESALGHAECGSAHATIVEKVQWLG